MLPRRLLAFLLIASLPLAFGCGEASSEEELASQDALSDDAPAGLKAGACGEPFTLREQHFQNLSGVAWATVYVHDIEATTTSFQPFEVAVTVGYLYEPFVLGKGRLTDAQYEDFTRPSDGSGKGFYGSKSVATVATVTPGQAASVTFVANSSAARRLPPSEIDQRYELKILSVDANWLSPNSVVLQLCR